MNDQKGFFYPRTATGRSSVIPSPPWYYSGDLLTVEYRTDPSRVAELLPAPLEPAPEDPGAVALIWADWQSCSSSREELLDPVRSQYKEAFVVVRCAFEGVTYSRCVYIWVDKDFAIARGMHQGYPKKLGSMWQTRPHPFAHAAPQMAAGGVFGATLAAGDRRLAEAVLTLREESPTNGFVNGHPMAHHRIYPGIEQGAPDGYAELIASGAAEFEGGPAWTGDVELRALRVPDRGAFPAAGRRGHRRLLPPDRRRLGRRPQPCQSHPDPRHGPRDERIHERIPRRGRGRRGRHPALDRRPPGRVGHHVHRRLPDRRATDRRGARRRAGRGRRRRRRGPRRLPGLGRTAGQAALATSCAPSPTASTPGAKISPGWRPATTARCCARTAAA